LCSAVSSSSNGREDEDDGLGCESVDDCDRSPPSFLLCSPESVARWWLTFRGPCSLPRHHIGEPGSSLFLGSGSQKYCTIRLYCPRSTLFIAGRDSWGDVVDM